MSLWGRGSWPDSAMRWLAGSGSDNGVPNLDEDFGEQEPFSKPSSMARNRADSPPSSWASFFADTLCFVGDEHELRELDGDGMVRDTEHEELGALSGRRRLPC